jgi:hypothetical protein
MLLTPIGMIRYNECMKPNTFEAIYARISACDETGCWQWTGRKDGSGYGRASYQGAEQLVHRIMWNRFRGAIPDGMVLDHLCGNKMCANPEHLEMVSYAENSRRNFKKIFGEYGDYCYRGHPLFGENVYIPPGTNNRHCRECRRIRKRTGRGRARGERNGQSKLTAAQVGALRQAVADGATVSSQARQFGISVAHACRIARGESWQLQPDHDDRNSTPAIKNPDAGTGSQSNE